MIVRISTENQYVFPDDQADRLNDLDNAVVAAVDGGRRGRLPRGFEELLALVRAEGTPLGVEELEESDVILPPPDTSFVEASAEFTATGLIPD